MIGGLSVSWFNRLSSWLDPSNKKEKVVNYVYIRFFVCGNNGGILFISCEQSSNIVMF